MFVEFYRGSPGKFDSRTLSRETLTRRTGRNPEALPDPAAAQGEAEVYYFSSSYYYLYHHYVYYHYYYYYYNSINGIIIFMVLIILRL